MRMLHRVLPLPLWAALALLASAALPVGADPPPAAGDAPASTTPQPAPPVSEPPPSATDKQPEAEAPAAAQPPVAAPAPAATEAPPPAPSVAPPAVAVAPPARVSWFHRHPHGAQPAWVAAANPLAVDAGLEILGKGGNAIDAAVAVQAMLGLVEPQSSGIAGGAFLLYYDAHSRKVSAVDGRERAPAGAQPDMFLDEHGKPLPFVEAVRSGRSTGVPGVIAMLYAAHAKLGALRWKELFQPAIRAASLGFRVPARLALLAVDTVWSAPLRSGSAPSCD